MTTDSAPLNNNKVSAPFTTLNNPQPINTINKQNEENLSRLIISNNNNEVKNGLNINNVFLSSVAAKGLIKTGTINGLEVTIIGTNTTIENNNKSSDNTFLIPAALSGQLSGSSSISSQSPSSLSQTSSTITTTTTTATATAKPIRPQFNTAVNNPNARKILDKSSRDFQAEFNSISKISNDTISNEYKRTKFELQQQFDILRRQLDQQQVILEEQLTLNANNINNYLHTRQDKADVLKYFIDNSKHFPNDQQVIKLRECTKTFVDEKFDPKMMLEQIKISDKNKESFGNISKLLKTNLDDIKLTSTMNNHRQTAKLDEQIAELLSYNYKSNNAAQLKPQIVAKVNNDKQGTKLVTVNNVKPKPNEEINKSSDRSQMNQNNFIHNDSNDEGEFTLVQKPRKKNN
jgi:hypothetical protein